MTASPVPIEAVSQRLERFVADQRAQWRDGGAETAAFLDAAAAALTGGAHPCDVVFGRDVVAVLETAERALGSGCRETVAR